MKNILLTITLLAGISASAGFVAAQNDNSTSSDAAILEQEAQTRAIENVLQTTKVSMDVEEITLNDLIKFIHKLSNLNIVISPKVYEEKSPEEFTISFSVTDMHLDALLDYIMDQFQLKARIVSGVIILEPANDKEEAEKKFTIVYYILDLMYEVPDFPGPNVDLTTIEGSDPFAPAPDEEDKMSPEKLITMITDATGGDDVWSKDGFSISYSNGLLMINANMETQKAVIQFLTLLRAAK